MEGARRAMAYSIESPSHHATNRDPMGDSGLRQPNVLDQLREASRSRHYSRSVEQTFCHWVRRYVHFSQCPAREWHMRSSCYDDPRDAPKWRAERSVPCWSVEGSCLSSLLLLLAVFFRIAPWRTSFLGRLAPLPCVDCKAWFPWWGGEYSSCLWHITRGGAHLTSHSRRQALPAAERQRVGHHARTLGPL